MRSACDSEARKRVTTTWVMCVAAVTLFAWLAAAAPAPAQVLSQGKGNLRVMTYNLDEGTDFNEVLGALLTGSFADVQAAVQLTINNVRATNPSARMAAVAREIAVHRPDLVGLQEVTQWRTTGLCADSETPEIDMLQLLLHELAELDQHYTAVAVQQEFNVTGLTPSFTCVRATNYDVILARTDEDDFKLTNVQKANFQIVLTFPTTFGAITIQRGWASVDAVIHGQALRFITTHLEDGTRGDGFALIQQAQAAEILQGPANTSMPIVLVGDFNADADNSSSPSFPAYLEILGGGFADAWTTANPSDPGFTCCQDPLLLNPISLLNQRIDFVFVRGEFGVAQAELIGASLKDRTPQGLWPSDHAGVAARLKIGEAE